MTALPITVNGKSFVVSDDHEDREFWRVVREGIWEPETFRIFDQFLDRNHCYLDVGAWIGPTVLYGAQLAKWCWAFEPDPVAFQKLEKNLLLNPSIDNVAVTDEALSAESGFVQFGNNERIGDSTSSALFAHGSDSWRATATTIEKFAAERGMDNCNFVKMDIEGGEYELIPAMADWLKAYRPTLYLSLHPQFVTEVEKKTQTVLDSLAFYRGRFQMPNSISILATDWWGDTPENPHVL
jgi:FkbM family methyltransferase